MARFAETLTIDVRASRIEIALSHAIHVAVIAVCLALVPARPALLWLLPVLVGAGYSAGRRAQRRSPSSIVNLRWHPDGTWFWQTRSGLTVRGVGVDAWVHGSWLVVLSLRPDESRRRRTTCVLFRDSVADRVHRRLRARLTVAPPGDVKVRSARPIR